MRPTGGMGHMGISGTGSMGYKGYGSHGQWGTWAMGPMGDLHFFAYNFINTEWILTKILLDIDIDVFYLNTHQFLAELL